MSGKSFYEKNKSAIFWAIALTIFFEVTKPENEKRPHWPEFYFHTILFFFIGNLFIFLSADYVQYQFLFNCVYAVLVVAIMVFKVNYDVTLVHEDRVLAREKARRMEKDYEDPYASNLSRRILIVSGIWCLHLLWGEMGISIQFTAILILVAVCLYALRDVLYIDCSGSISPENKDVDSEISDSEELFLNDSPNRVRDFFIFMCFWFVPFALIGLAKGKDLSDEAYWVTNLAGAIFIGFYGSYKNYQEYKSQQKGTQNEGVKHEK